ncbi:hypothetical protein OV759_12680, partial [Salmonella enterica subsp. enterica serovar 1,4,[5],12:i:-]|nr:hypothetical protein [Salmonella enterica subsp. enterica serovar 1,4,[5],12:i:-]MDI5399876.1 hypothetical protein [Salmonella enterica subsp. enterica serovar Kentucky]
HSRLAPNGHGHTSVSWIVPE